MKCTICKKEILLVPSAKERSNKYGENPSYYINLFTTHSKCFINKRNNDTIELIRKINLERNKLCN